ncbi:MAG: hypothetical protein V1736_10960 [Pseudomonadota bacterium]
MKKYLSNNVVNRSIPIFLSTLIFVFLPFSLSLAASVPQLVNYQGMLTDAQGAPLETKEYKLSFSIYSVSLGGTAVWGPQVFDSVPVVRGHFNVILGPKDTSNRDIANAFTTSNAYLEIKVGDSTPIAPRQQVLSTPYALQAEKSAYAVQAVTATISTHHSNIIPVGTIVAFFGHVLPPGWRWCNGENNTPDLRGVFLRGLDDGRGLDPGRGFGTYQADEFRNHNHGNGDYKYLLRITGTSTSKYTDNSSSEPDLIWAGEILAAGGSETRPKNVAVKFIMYVGY